jgi:2-methylisocitrate lyase-like PEP mutase family enzyme
MNARADIAATFHQLHHGPKLLVLPNAWDAGSARLIESLGAQAIATTSAGVAWSHGYPDGDALPVRLLVSTIAATARVIRVPLTADIEGGYSQDPASVGENVAAVIDAGAVGINIEDGSEPPELLCAKITRAKEVGTRLGVDVFVNARIDVYLRNLATGAARIDETLARAKRYQEAGADGIFVPAVSDPNEIRKIASATDLPLNVLAWSGLPPASELAQLGVRRLSAGSGIARSLWSRGAVLAKGFLSEGRSDLLMEGDMSYADINAVVAGS